MPGAISFAPHWVLLREIEHWIEREFGIACSSGDAFTTTRKLLVGAVRHQHIIHRVAGYWDAVRRLKGGEPILPEGVTLQYLHVEPPKVFDPQTMRITWSLSSKQFPVVADWDAADVDWNDGTIVGTRKRGNGPRLDIELFWLSVADVVAKLKLQQADRGARQVGDPPSSQQPGKLVYSEPALRGWFSLRVASWPKDKAPPSEKTDFADAATAFDALPSREQFRAIRAEKTPAIWRKPGPRVGSK